MRKRDKTEFPNDFVLDDPKRETFRKFNPTATDVELTLQFEKFKAHHQMRGDEFSNWNAAWTYWATHAAQYGFRPRFAAGTFDTCSTEIPRKRPNVPLGPVARTTWAKPKPIVNGATPVREPPRPPATPMPPDKQKAALAKLIGGIGK